MALEVPLAEITNQFVLDKAWDGKLEDCHRYGQVAMTIAADDLETMELMLRCARARGLLWSAETWVRSAYAVRLASPVARYALGLARLLRGDPAGARKILEPLGSEAPVAYYQAAIAAQIEDDAANAERLVNLYLKASPNDPAGRLLQAELVCSLDLPKCAAIQDTIKSTDEDETVLARRLGAGLGAGTILDRATLERLAKDAASFGAPAFDDAYVVASLTREGGDPTVFVRSPRTGRPEVGSGSDLERDARPMQRLPFITRVLQAAARNDGNAAIAYAQLLELFPAELATYRLARRLGEKGMLVVRKSLENQPQVTWRTIAASLMARTDEVCPLAWSLPWTDRGPLATMARARCEIITDAWRGRKIADDRLNVLPFGVADVEIAIEGEVGMHDSTALEALARKLQKIAPASTLVPAALWAAAENAKKGKRQTSLFAEAVTTSAYEPYYSRKLLRRYVDAKDIDHARMAIAQALVESPLDAYLCGVEGAILMSKNDADGALAWLTKSCVSARARKERDTLDDTLSAIQISLPKAKNKVTKEAASKCLKGDGP